ncbi:lipase [Streptomyces sp. NPDC092952]|uniref:alpha/beta hydrolase n=1 Tax=Streptomyces sp. NPDC092952 TaxID=3366018 RepID=UPI0037F19F08
MRKGRAHHFPARRRGPGQGPVLHSGPAPVAHLALEARRHGRQEKVGMAGHSLGGASTGASMEKDSRVRTGVNMDGPFINAGKSSDLSGRPFMMLGTKDDHSPGDDTTWDTAWKQLKGWKRWATLTGAEHMSFTDLVSLAGQLGADDPEGLPGERAAEITRDYVGAFFDRHLHGRHQALLGHPGETRPEVTLQHRDSRDPSPRS